MCCKSNAYGSTDLHGCKQATHHNIHGNVCTGTSNSLYHYDNVNCQHTSVNMTKGKVCCNNWLNVEAPCFLDNSLAEYKFNVFAPVFVPKVNLNIDVTGPAYINNAGCRTIFGSRSSVNINLLKTNNNHSNGMCGCTNGFETKNQTLVHNILISSLDGDPSCGGDIFHNTCSYQQFEYKVEDHQMLGASNIIIISNAIDACVNVLVSPVTTFSSEENLFFVSLHEVNSSQMSKNCSDATISITSHTVYEEFYTSIQAFQQGDYKADQWIGNDSDSCTYTLHSEYCYTANTYTHTEAPMVQYNPGSVPNTPSCTYSDNKYDTFKFLVNETSINDNFIGNILQNGCFGEIVTSNPKYSGKEADIACVLSERILLATGELGKNTIYWAGVGFMPCDYVLPSYGSSSKQLGHADMLEWVKNANYIVRKSGKHNYLETRLTVSSGLNIFNWWRYLEHYNLKILCEYLKFGFPFCVDETILKYSLEVTNHASVLRNPTGVDKYFTEEVQYNAMLGPLATPPFTKMHFSLIMARAKADGGTRVIVDLSWPHANSINSCVPTNNFDFMTFQQSIPPLTMLWRKLDNMGVMPYCIRWICKGHFAIYE